MKLIDINSEVVQKNYTNIKRKILKHFDTKPVSIYCYEDGDEYGFIVMYIGKGILIKEDNSCYEFTTGSTGKLCELNRNGYVIRPRIDFDFEDGRIATTEVSITSEDGTESSISTFPVENDDFYRRKVSFKQYNEGKDLFCEMCYGTSNEDKIHPGLLTTPENIYIINKASKGLGCKPGFVPRRMQMYSRSINEKDTLNYTFSSFNEKGVINTLRNGPFNLDNGSNYAVRYCKMGFMTANNELSELPWPLSDYKT